MGFCKSMFSFSGFMDRADYWKAVLLYIFLPFFLFGFFAFLCGWYDVSTSKIILHPLPDMNALEIITLLFGLYVIYAFTIGMLAVMAKRLRDISISPYMGLLYIIPPLSPFIVLLYGMFPTNVNSYER